MALVLATKVGPCGGSGGQMRDMDITGITRIVKIDVRHATIIDAVAVHYERNERNESTDLWGGQGGNLTEINLQQSEYITSVRGHIGNFQNILIVRSLKFETNLGTYGPYGREEGTPFELPALGGEIVGFHGRSGTYLDALGVYVKTSVPGGVHQKEENFHLYLHQHYEGPSKNQAVVINANLSNHFGDAIMTNWAVLDGPDAGAKVVARAQGLQCVMYRETFHTSFSMVFEDDKFKGSSLEVRGPWKTDSPVEWAIVGGTGQFTLAQGVIYGKKISQNSQARVVDLVVSVFYRPIQKPNLA